MKKNPLIGKGLAVGIILLFVGTCIIPSTAQDTEKPLPTSRGHWLYVGGSGPGNYSKITDAVNDASDGDTVFVYNDSSPYYENTILINTSINLIGEDRNTTIIDGKGGGHSIDVIHIYTNDVTVTGFTIRNCSGDIFDIGIYIRGKGDTFKDIPIISNVNISGNIFIDTATGILELKTFHTIISGNTILSSNSSDSPNHTTFGIESVLSSSTIRGNTILNPRVYGMNFFWSHCLVEGNVISNGTQQVNKWGISQRDSSNRIIGNTITNFSVGIRLNGISMFNIISQNKISHCTRDGIALEMTSVLNIITKNNISQCERHGIALYLSLFTVVKENNFIKNNASAFFLLSMRTRWVRNYWDDWNGTGPKIIKGSAWVNFDWRPAKEPYDIPGIR
jgi:parallel beta-helix repeat protein